MFPIFRALPLTFGLRPQGLLQPRKRSQAPAVAALEQAAGEHQTEGMTGHRLEQHGLEQDVRRFVTDREFHPDLDPLPVACDVQSAGCGVHVRGVDRPDMEEHRHVGRRVGDVVAGEGEVAREVARFQLGSVEGHGQVHAFTRRQHA